MVLESTVICVDNSDFMRNGDFLPTRLQAQQDAVNLVCHSKTRANPENNVGLLTLANTEVLVTLTTDAGRLLAKLHQVQPSGNINLLTGIRIAHLVLKHRQGKNHKMRIIVFVGSPIEAEEKEIVKVAKRLKKEKVNIDLINFGEDLTNAEKLSCLVNAVNGNDGSGSHMVTVPPGPHLSDALLSSPVIQGEDGTGAVGLGSASGFEFGVDPNEDPELALALRVSMEEQRQRQEEEARKAGTQSTDDAAQPPTTTESKGTTEDALLEKALAMSVEGEGTTASTPLAESSSTGSAPPNFASMTEEEQIAYAMQMSLQTQEEPMETDDTSDTKEKKENQNEDYSEVMSDPAFLQSVLQNLAGVDPQSEAVRNAIDSITQQNSETKDNNDKEEKK